MKASLLCILRIFLALPAFALASGLYDARCAVLLSSYAYDTAGPQPTGDVQASAPTPNAEAAGHPRSSDEDIVTLSTGSVIHIRLADEVNSGHDKAGDLYTGTVDPSVLIRDHVVIPRGTEAHIRLVDVKKGGHFHGKAKVRLELVSLIINGERLGVETDQPSKKEGAAHAKASAAAKKGPEGAGAMAGNPGAVAGPIIAALSAAKVDVKPGSRIEFTLEEPFSFRPPPPQVQPDQP
jgi:hypothetical protein